MVVSRLVHLLKIGGSLSSGMEIPHRERSASSVLFFLAFDFVVNMRSSAFKSKNQSKCMQKLVLTAEDCRALYVI